MVTVCRQKLLFCSRVRFTSLRGAYKVKRALPNVANGRHMIVRETHLEVRLNLRVASERQASLRRYGEICCGVRVEEALLHAVRHNAQRLCSLPGKGDSHLTSVPPLYLNRARRHIRWRGAMCMLPIPGSTRAYGPWNQDLVETTRQKPQS